MQIAYFLNNLQGLAIVSAAPLSFLSELLLLLQRYSFFYGQMPRAGREGPAMLSSSKQERDDSVQFQAQRGTRQGLGLLLPYYLRRLRRESIRRRRRPSHRRTAQAGRSENWWREEGTFFPSCDQLFSLSFFPLPPCHAPPPPFCRECSVTENGWCSRVLLLPAC